MEWGWAGGTLWAVIFFGGIATGIYNIRWQENFRRAARIHARERPFEFCSERAAHSPVPGTWEWTSRQRLLLPLSILALIGVAAHALIDFPLQIASIQLYAVTFLGICWGGQANARHNRHNNRHTSLRHTRVTHSGNNKLRRGDSAIDSGRARRADHWRW